MKRAILFFGILLMGFTAGAQPDSELVRSVLEGFPSCSNSVRFDDENIYLGFGAYKRGFEEPRQPIPAMVQIIPLNSPEKYFGLNTSDAALDTVRDGDTLFVLTYSGIEEWNLERRVRAAIYQTYAYPRVMEYKEHAMAWARYKDKVIIAHGRLGISTFNLKTRRLAHQFRLLQRQLPLESMATAVVVVGQYAYVVMDNFSLTQNGQKPAFRGVIVIDMETEKVVREMGGLDPGADAIATDGQEIFVSYLGFPIWKYKVHDLSGAVLPAPQMIWKFPMKGHPMGTASLDDKYYFTCVSKPNPAGGRSTFVPMALPRNELHP